ncbi:MAG TPA: hypothetical protein VH353_02120 [Caulobacteraceae bacterium]|jgi:hypothetical protein|nr:hypothetical protein [Caulobacteraceae bacterium]
MRVGVGPGAVDERLLVLGRAPGPPWSEDQRLAMLAAWVHRGPFVLTAAFHLKSIPPAGGLGGAGEP